MPWQDLLSIAPVIGDVIGGELARGQSRRDIARQNAYNHPAQQAQRLREAGLPLALMTGTASGNQSALPQTSGQSIGGGVGKIANYITTQTQLKQLEILKEEARLKRSEADKNQAETDWLLSGRGIDRAGTNLTSNLRTQQLGAQLGTKAQEIANNIQSAISQNTPQRLQLENQKLTQDILSLINQRRLTDKQVDIATSEAAIKRVIAGYQENMSREEFAKLLKENDLLDKNITGKGIENDIDAIRYRVSKATESNQIALSDMDLINRELSWDKLKTEFQTYNEYLQFKREADKMFKSGGLLTADPIEMGNRIMALLYTFTHGTQGDTRTPNLLFGLR